MASPVKATIQDIRRFGDITSVLTKHGFDAVARRATPQQEDDQEALLLESDEDLIGDRSEAAVRFRHVLEDLGPTFVKLGQVMSTRPDIMPPEFIQELRTLQDKVPALSPEEVVGQITRALGKHPDDLFATFDPVPIGAASIGQVHCATMHDGRACVIKVQRPGIAEKIRADLDILYSFAKLLEITIAEVELYSPTGIVREFSSALLKELDFTLEARNLEEFRRNFDDRQDISAPQVIWELTTAQVMTMERVEAKKLSDLDPGTEFASQVLDTILDAMVQMVLYDGLFHGDPHPGNIFVKENGEVVFIDFGMVGRLSAAQQDDIVDLILSVMAGDVDTIARTLLKMGRPVGRVNLRAFKSDIVRIRDSYLLSNLSDINVTRFVQDVLDAAQVHRIQLNPTYAVLVKTASTIEGIMRGIEPDLDLLARARPYVSQLVAKRFSARKLATSALRTSMAFSSFATRFPEQMDQILMDLEGGNLSLSVRNDALDNIGQHINTLGTRIFLGISSSGLAVCAALLLRDTTLEVASGVSLILIAGLLCALVATLLFWWALGWHIVGGKESHKLRISPLMRFLRRP